MFLSRLLLSVCSIAAGAKAEKTDQLLSLSTPLAKRKIAFVIFGTARHWKTVKGWHELCLQPHDRVARLWPETAKRSVRTFVLDIVRANGFKKVDVFLSLDNCTGSTSDVHSYGPYLRGVATSSQWSSRLTKFQKGLELLDNSGEKYDFVVLTRPDMMWYRQVDVSRFVLEQGIVWPCKCEVEAWLRFQCVSDIFISASSDALERLRARCSKELFNKFHSSGHYTYKCALKEHVIETDQAAFYVGNDTNLVINTRDSDEATREILPFSMPGGKRAADDFAFAQAALRREASARFRSRKEQKLKLDDGKEDPVPE